MIWLIFGPPGSGKGTQSHNLSAEFGLAHLSTGEVLRAEVAEGSPEGRKVAGHMAAGELLPDEVMVRMVSKRLRRDPGESVLLDGFPRTATQAAALDRLLHQEGRRVDLVIALTAPEGDLVERILGRAAVEKRSDDTRAAIEERMLEYHQRSEPVLDHYQATGVPVLEIDGVGDPDQVFERVRAAVLRQSSSMR